MMKPCFTEYDCNWHRSVHSGYRNQRIVTSATKYMAKLVVKHRWISQTVRLMVVDNSTCVLAAATLMRVCDITKGECLPRLMFPNMPDKWDESVRPTKCNGALLVFVDDYLYDGGSLKVASQWVKRPMDLGVFIKCRTTLGMKAHVRQLYDLQSDPKHPVHQL